MITQIADFLCGYPLFILLIGGGFFLFFYSGMVSLRRLPDAMRVLRDRHSRESGNQISSLQALASVVAATVGMGNIAGVAIALVMGGPGAIFWMWVSALVGMSTKFHEGVLTTRYKVALPDGTPAGGTMHIIDRGLGPHWHWLAVTFAVAGMFGTLCIMNANQLTEAVVATFTTPQWLGSNHFISTLASASGWSHLSVFRLIVGLSIAVVVTLVVIGGVRRIAHVATWLVPFMVGLYFLSVLYIVVTHISEVPGVFRSIFTEAFSLRAGWGALAGIAIIGARRAALVNDAGVGTATIMHGASTNTNPAREGLIAMLGPGIDSGLVCTLTALAILLCGDIEAAGGIKGLEVAMGAFGKAIPYGEYLLMLIVLCFALSSMFSYSFYGRRCAAYLFGEKRARAYTWFFIATMVIFAVIPLGIAVGFCDLFYALMAFPTMITLLLLRKEVRQEIKKFSTF
ncbi:sodium:alanine symporter family protein [Duncaniella freteri]|uniref:alanine/glycine:cation symporter family protein n=1 Tax=Duncaniella freteri TaxID=2530391 RepID=UPI00136E46AE|nr:alanine/glycine:cation symporter family protein [Duncaniella freteri]NBJ06937.1 alanine:cation symporter family protein [Alistipes sp. Z76]NCE69029.1 alanine:cation symporter family protein [Muribaculaceae bacterium M3]